MTEQHSWKQEEDKEGIAMKFENKVAIITGSTRGIGRATAELFAKEGAKVIVVGTKEELGESCVNEIKAAGGEAIFCKTDVTSDESLDNLVKTARDAYGKIDILVNNAGVGGTTANMDQITMDEWNTVLATNLTAPFVARMIEGALNEVDRGLIEASSSMGASNSTIILKVMIPETMPHIIHGITVTVISLIGFSAMAGTIGAGGLGDLAIRFGYQRFKTDIMIYSVIVIILLVQVLQSFGNYLVYRAKRNR